MPDAPQAQMTLFPTAIGQCAVAWSGEVVRSTQLPDGEDGRTVARMSARAGGARMGVPPAAITRAIEAMAELLEGGRTDLSFIACDFSALEPFAVDVYTLARAIPPGETLTYGDIASRLGDKALSRAVGHALGRNPFPIIVPCHRVLGANGRLTGFSADGGVATKLRMLAIEGARIGSEPTLFDELPLTVKPGRNAPRP